MLAKQVRAQRLGIRAAAEVAKKMASGALAQMPVPEARQIPTRNPEAGANRPEAHRRCARSLEAGAAAKTIGRTRGVAVRADAEGARRKEKIIPGAGVVREAKAVGREAKAGPRAKVEGAQADGGEAEVRSAAAAAARKKRAEQGAGARHTKHKQRKGAEDGACRRNPSAVTRVGRSTRQWLM